jgi:hypothetical protein
LLRRSKENEKRKKENKGNLHVRVELAVCMHRRCQKFIFHRSCASRLQPDACHRTLIHSASAAASWGCTGKDAMPRHSPTDAKAEPPGVLHACYQEQRHRHVAQLLLKPWADVVLTQLHEILKSHGQILVKGDESWAAKSRGGRSLLDGGFVPLCTTHSHIQLLFVPFQTGNLVRMGYFATTQ